MIFSLLVKEQEGLPPLYSCSPVPEPVSGVDNRGSGSCCVVSEQKLGPLPLMLQVDVQTTGCCVVLGVSFFLELVYSKKYIFLYIPVYISM